jgi:hypothetical protein
MTLQNLILHALVISILLVFGGCAKEGKGKREAQRSTREVNGMKVTLVQISGTYLAPGGPMMESQGKKDNYKLLGAIVEGPEGSVFFKFTGPAHTVNAARVEFDGMIGSLTHADGKTGSAVAGVQWVMPSRWSEEHPRPMRVVTYTVPSAEGDPEPGECAVFYFGNDQGGGVDANIERWVTQFEKQ